MVRNHLNANSQDNQIVEDAESKTSDVVLLCSGIRKDARISELKKVFTVNSLVSVKNIKKADNYILIYYTSIKTALSIIKTFEEIKEEFSLCFGDSSTGLLCELIWPNNFVDHNETDTDCSNLSLTYP